MERPVSEQPTIVLLHAFPLDHRMWSAQAEYLRGQGFGVVTPDLPGFGGTPLLDGPPDLVAVAQHVIDHLPPGPVVVGGLSLGGYVTMAMLRLGMPNLVGAMLCDTKATADPEAGRANRLGLADRLEEAGGDAGQVFREALLHNLLGDTTRVERPIVQEQVGHWLDEADGATGAWYMRAMAARPESLDVLGALTVPTLVLWGDEDLLSPPADHLAMVDALREARAVEIPGAGHLTSVESPRATATAIEEFVRGL